MRDIMLASKVDALRHALSALLEDQAVDEGGEYVHFSAREAKALLDRLEHS